MIIDMFLSSSTFLFHIASELLFFAERSNIAVIPCVVHAANKPISLYLITDLVFLGTLPEDGLKVKQANQ